MADTLTATCEAQFSWVFTNDLEISVPKDSGTATASVTIEDGTGTSQADMLYHDRFSIATSGNQQYDLAGSLTGPFGSTLTFVDVKALLIFNKGAGSTYAAATITSGESLDIETNSTLVSGAGLTGIVESGGLFARVWPVTGIAVTASLADLIQLDNNGSSTVQGDFVIMGTSA